MGYRVAVVGATGNVGREILGILSERAFPADEVVALASRRSVGREISFGENVTLKVRALEDFDFDGVDFGLFSPGSAGTSWWYLTQTGLPGPGVSSKWIVPDPASYPPPYS